MAVLRRAGGHVPAPVRVVFRRLISVALVAGFVLGFTPVAALAAGTGDAGGTPTVSSLPLLRWANAVATIHTHYGVGSVVSAGDPFLTAIAGLLFQVSALLWQVLGTLVTDAQGTDAVRQTVQLVDPVYRQIGDAVVGTTGQTSIVALVIVAGAAMVAYQAYQRGSGVSGALRGLAGVVLPIGLLVVTVHSAAHPQSNTAAVPGSPSWTIQRVTGWTTTLSGSVAHLSDGFASVGTSGITGKQDATMADCAKYVDGLDNLYAQQKATPGTGPSALQVADSVTLSQIWESAVMAPWMDAQFGAGPLGQKAFCHLLEIQANVPAAAQVAAMAADVPGGPYSKGHSGPTWSQLVAGHPYHDESDPAYVPLLGPDFANGDDDLRRNMVAWAECDYTGGDPAMVDSGWKVDPAFSHVFNTSPTSDSCRTWWNHGDTKPPPHGGTVTTNGPFDFEDENVIHTATTVNGNNAADARNYIQGLNGHNAGLALSTSLIALVSSITYAWSLGGLALGVLIGKLSLIILVACAPIFLLLAAVPSAATRRAARKALGLSFAALLSTFTFSVLMGLMLLFIGLLQQVTLGLFPDSGTLPGLIEGLIPLAALFLLRKLLRLVGMDSITSLRGAIKTTAAFGQMGTNTAAPATLRSRLRQVTDLTTAADALQRRARSGIRSSSSAMDRPKMPERSTPPAAAPLPWNRTWRSLVDSRALPRPARTGPVVPAPPPASMLSAGRPPPTALSPVIRTSPPRSSLALGPAPASKAIPGSSPAR
ncbi:MAG: hypothetical protein M3137_06605, partial [Actinomycetota bacterium]|nr:hypothetical protein [Actinomycetota bacterium]